MFLLNYWCAVAWDHESKESTLRSHRGWPLVNVARAFSPTQRGQECPRHTR